MTGHDRVGPLLFEGIVPGTIINEKRGTGGFGYDPVFYIPGLKKTFAELSTMEKNKISHRGIALVKIRELLKSKYL